MPVVEVTDLRRSYGAFEALRGVSFSIEPGEIVGLLGPNGAGKTTTMKVLTGLVAPTSGNVRVAGIDVLTDPVAVRRHLGWLPEGAPLYEEMTVHGTLRFAGRARALGAAELSRALDRVATQCGLTERMQQTVGTLSRGFRQRVGLAVALLHEPSILVLDEPTTGLDPNQVADIRDLIRSVGRKRTVLLSTHVLSEVEATCDRVLILHHGRLVADDATASIVAATRGTTVRIGVAPGKVRVTSAGVIEQLCALPGVTGVHPLAPGDEGLRFEVSAETDPRQQLFRWAVDGGHVLDELTPVSRDLAEVFRTLTEAA